MDIIADAADMTMDTRQRLQAYPSWLKDPSGKRLEPDGSELLTRLLLFDQYLMRVRWFSEVPYLVNTWGVDATTELLKSGALKLLWDDNTVAFSSADPPDAARIRRERRKQGVDGLIIIQPPQLPVYNVEVLHSFSGDRTMQVVDQRIHDSVSPLKLPTRKSNRLTDALKGATRLERIGLGSQSIKSLWADEERDTALLRSGISFLLRLRYGDTPQDYKLRVRRDSDGTVSIDTNLGRRLRGISQPELWRLIGQSLLGVANLAQRLVQMEEHNAVIAFDDSEVEMLGARLSFLLQQVDPNAQLRRYDRITSVTGVPSITDPTNIDLDRFLEVRASPECRDFRHWLRQSDLIDATQVEERLLKLRSRVASVTNCGAGKTVRFLTTTGAGFVPIVGPGLGLALSGIDTFLVDRVVGNPGPLAFLSRGYRSIFKEYPLRSHGTDVRGNRRRP